MRPIRSILSALALTAAAPAFACSMVSGYKVPTNLELATAADAIVVATVEGEQDHILLAKPTLLIKGSALPETVEIGGSLDTTLDMQATRSDPRELRAPNPDALSGACVRHVFSPGMKLVLFLKRDENGTLQPYRSSFSRDAEDVPADDALWVKAVREYADISTLPAAERKSRLERRIAELKDAGDADSLAIAKDMDIELNGKRLPPTD